MVNGDGAEAPASARPMVSKGANRAVYDVTRRPPRILRRERGRRTNEYLGIVPRRIANRGVSIDVDSNWPFSCGTIHRAINAAGRAKAPQRWGQSRDWYWRGPLQRLAEVSFSLPRITCGRFMRRTAWMAGLVPRLSGTECA
jgi:hypothetical protein